MQLYSGSLLSERSGFDLAPHPQSLKLEAVEPSIRGSHQLHLAITVVSTSGPYVVSAPLAHVPNTRRQLRHSETIQG